MTVRVVAEGGWDITSFLKNLTSSLQGWGGLIIGLLGVVMIIAACYQFAMALIKKNQQTEWFKILALLIIGGAFAVGGWDLVSGIASGGKKTLEDLGTGAIGMSVFIPGLFM